MSVGAYHYKQVNFQSIYDQSLKYLFGVTQIEKYSGMTLTTLNDSEFDAITLNGTFVSTKGRKPLYHSYSDGSYKIDKARLFLFDSSLSKYVYGSYTGKIQLNDSNDSRLTYNLQQGHNFTMSLQFKIPLAYVQEGLRTIFSFTNSALQEKIGIYVNDDDYLCYATNGNLQSTNGIITNDIYHTISILVQNTSCTLLLDDEVVATFTNPSISNCLLHLGCSIKLENNREVAYRHLNGNLMNLLFTNSARTDCVQNMQELLSQSQSLTKYDCFGRISSEKIIFKNGEYTQNMEYLHPIDENGDILETHTTLNVGKITDSFGNETHYEYDGNGNITKVILDYDETTKVTEYVYDGLSRLIQSESEDQTTTYTYDENGNIQSKQVEKDNEIEVYQYVYDSNNSEKLLEVIKQVDDVTQESILFTYNSNFYPTSIGNKLLTWQGSNLMSINTLHFSYDALGRRMKKTDGNSTTKFIYDKEHLIAEECESYKIVYLYNEKNELKGFVHITNDSQNTYYFIKDLFGVITGILDSSGQQICSYKYDDFGKLLSQTGDSNILSINHFLYKSYYYDEETGWYYLEKRYYIPDLCRFISPDVIENLNKVSSSMIQYNLFSYCDNNPILRMDSTGQSWVDSLVKKIMSPTSVIPRLLVGLCSVIGAIAGTIVGTIASVISIGAGIAEHKSINEILNDVKDSLTTFTHAGFLYGSGAGLIMIGNAMGIEELISKGNGLFERATNIAENYIMDNILGFAIAGDAIHECITNKYINVGSLFSGNVFGMVIGVIGLTYTCFQEVKARDNYTHNREYEHLLIESASLGSEEIAKIENKNNGDSDNDDEENEDDNNEENDEDDEGNCDDNDEIESNLENVDRSLFTDILIPDTHYNTIIDDKKYICGQGYCRPHENDDTLEPNANGLVCKYDYYKFGLKTVKSNGCAVMAVYNLNLFLNRNVQFCDLLYYFERKNLVFAALGVWPTHLRKYLEDNEILFDEYYKEEDISAIERNRTNYRCFLVTYWRQRGIGSAHTILVVPVHDYVSRKHSVGETEEDFEFFFDAIKLIENGDNRVAINDEVNYEDAKNLFFTANDSLNLVDINEKNIPFSSLENVFYTDYYSDNSSIPYERKIISIFAIK